MGTTTKSLKLLDHFRPDRPEIGLSEMARISGRNKASVYRSLSEMTEAGLLEHVRTTRKYRLGPMLIRLANIREATFPIKAAMAESLDGLVQATRETAHASLLQGDKLIPVQSLQSTYHVTRVAFDVSEPLPLHATSSGCVVLAFSQAVSLDDVIGDGLSTFTENTLVDADALRGKIFDVRQTGFAVSDGEFEAEVCSIGAPLFGADGDCTGAVSVVCPASRFKPELQLIIREQLKAAAMMISHSLGGEIPNGLRELWEPAAAA